MKFISRDREKRINASIYFAEGARRFDGARLARLLYLLDFEHFRQAGRSVTGLDYVATKDGPMPAMPFVGSRPLEHGHASHAGAAVAEPAGEYTAQPAHDPAGFDAGHFTRRELRIMEALRKRFPAEVSQLLDDATEEERAPWVTTWDNGRGDLARIPYALAIHQDDPHADIVRETAAEYEGMKLAQRVWS